MKVFSLIRALAALAGAMIAGQPAPAATLRIGDAAPPLQVAKWVQGEPVPAFDTNHVYIVEFWATWYAPCQTSLARLNGIWQQYRGVGLIAIGMDVFEKDDGAVPAFLKAMGDKLTYPVALDDKTQEKAGAMAVNWMKAAGQTGVPTAFVVNRQGRIAWIGHPLALEQSTLEDILADKFDVAANAREFDQQQQAQADRQVLLVKLNQALKAGDWDTADAAAAQMERALPEIARYKASPIRLQILILRQDYAGACKLAASVSQAAPHDAYLQNDLAWRLATARGLDSPALALAQTIAERANSAAGGNNPAILDTLARTQFLNGQTNQAVATEQKAVDAAADNLKADMKRCLADYQQGKLPEIKE
jgi:thiol-disulfide isomerase/thioredoxin